MKKNALKVHIYNQYRISSYSFCGNYSFLNLEIQGSQYIRPKVTVHKCAETIQGRKLFKAETICGNMVFTLLLERHYFFASDLPNNHTAYLIDFSKNIHQHDPETT